MGGGLLNIISYGNQNVILNGNPSKTFFKTVYSKYTNFGMQKFRIDYEGLRSLKLNEDTQLTFKIPRNGDLLMDAFLVFNLPDIWSTMIPPKGDLENENSYTKWKNYEFRWIEHIGTNAIRRVRCLIGGQVIQEFSGEYIKNMAERDFDKSKKDLFHQMIGHDIELYKPENAFGRPSRYPNSYYIATTPTNPLGMSNPSIPGRTIYVPLHFWFMNSPKMSLPMVSLQYNEVTIEVTMRPIRELFTINDVTAINFENNPVQPNFVKEAHSFYRFIQPPPSNFLLESDYKNKVTSWNADIHLVSTFGFVTEEESKVFAKEEQSYLIKTVKEDTVQQITGTNRYRLDSNSLSSNWMWFFRRNDCYQRNQWSNYSNWKYTDKLPYDLVEARTDTYVANSYAFGPGLDFYKPIGDDKIINKGVDRLVNQNFTCPYFTNENRKNIMTKFSIILDGKYREVDFESGVYSFIDKYNYSKGHSNPGLYGYSFSLNTSPQELQPSGAINLSRFKTIELEFSTILPEINPGSSFNTICDEEGTLIGVEQTGSLYQYDYSLFFTEERYNVLRVKSGYAALLYAQ
jgi:hypothetical protein